MLKLLDNNFLDANLKIKNGNIFFRDSQKEVLFINKINNLKYYYDPFELINILYVENEIFNFPYSLKIINYEDEKKLYSELNWSIVNLYIKNMHNYKDEIKFISSSIILYKKKNKIDNKIQNNYIDIDYYEITYKKK